MNEVVRLRARRALCMRRAFALRIAFVLLASGFVTAGQPTAATAAADTCLAASVWVSPRVVNYRNVLRDAQEPRGKPNFTVFIELPDGSAGDIDPASVTLNGLPALPEPSSVGDANGNGIADLMVKFDRSALITTEGALGFTGRTRSGRCFAGETTVEIIWCPVERSDYSIDFTTSNMPDESLNGLPARLDVQRVKPAAGCPTVAALVLSHGRTIPASAAFDLQYADYSLMERLAMRGIDTFAADHLGLGFSSLLAGLNPLDDARNASLPECAIDPRTQKCAPLAKEEPGENCDCQGLPRIQKMDQQGSTRHLNPNPLDKRWPHPSKIHFQHVGHQVAQLMLVVDDALAKTGLAKVHLLGLSFGGPVIGKYLGDKDPYSIQLTATEAVTEGRSVRHGKVAGAIFLASTFGGGQTAEEATTTFPLAVIDRADALENFNLAGPSCKPGDGCVSSNCTPVDPDCAKGLLDCPGQQEPGIQDPFWEAIQARDPVGPHWGPQPGGLSRSPVVPRFGWTAAVAQEITVPGLVINGLKDSVVRVAASAELWSSSPPQGKESPVLCTTDAQCAPGYACRSFPGPAQCRLNNRVLEQLDCASHALLWETCSGEGCIDPHRRVQKRIADWILNGK